MNYYYLDDIRPNDYTYNNDQVGNNDHVGLNDLVGLNDQVGNNDLVGRNDHVGLNDQVVINDYTYNNDQIHHIGHTAPTPGNFIFIASCVFSIWIFSCIIILLYHKYKWTNKIMAHELKCLNIVTTKCDKNTIYNPEICVICLDDFKENESISELECKHSYHSQCINEWIVKMPICPYCKN